MDKRKFDSGCQRREKKKKQELQKAGTDPKQRKLFPTAIVTTPKEIIESDLRSGTGTCSSSSTLTAGACATSTPTPEISLIIISNSTINSTSDTETHDGNEDYI